MEAYIGLITLFAGNFAPRGWASCEGQLLAISQNTALFSILGTTYGGNGVNTFALPDLRGRAAIGQGQGPGLPPYVEGQLGGSPTVTLTTGQLPAHTHTLQLNNSISGMATTAQSNYPNAKTESGESIVSSGPSLVNANPAAVLPAGGGQPVSTMPPYLTMFYIICIEGIFPSRN